MDQLLFDVGVKGVVVLTAATVAVRRLEDGPAAIRHLVWAIALASLVALPLLSTAVPEWRVEILPERAVATTAGVAAAAPEGVPWGRWAAFAWIAGAMAVAATTAVGRLRVAWIARRSESLDHGAWPALAHRLSGEIGLSRRVRVRMVDREIMPMVWGVFRPVVLLPRSAEGWDASLRRHVLLHELAHVQRHDYTVQLIGRLALAIHWFDPLAWRAARRLRLERERACDDHVLGCGASACDYARDLVEMARRLGPARRSALAIGLARSSGVAERVVALLDGARPRRVVTRRVALVGGTLAAGIVLPLAAIQPTSRTAATVDVAEATPPPGPTPAANLRWAREAEPAEPALRERRPVRERRPSAEPRPAQPVERAAQIVHVDPIHVTIQATGLPRGADALNASREVERLSIARIDHRSPTDPGERSDQRGPAPTTASDTCEEGDPGAPPRPAQLVSTTPEAATP